MSSPTHLKNIAIVGASGTIGSYIVSSLLSTSKFNITALTRHDSTSTFPPSITVTQIDYTNPSTLIAALQNQDALIITLSVFAPPTTQPALIHAAATAGVPWILPNEFGMFNTEAAQNETIGSSKTQARQLIEKLGRSALIGVTCGFWYEYSLSGGYYGIDIAKREVEFFDDGTERLNTSTWEQVGRGVAGLLELPVGAAGNDGDDGTAGAGGAGKTLNGYRNRMVYISSFAVSQKEMFESVKRVVGGDDAGWKVSTTPSRERFDQAKEELKSQRSRAAFGRALYTRYFLKGEKAGLFEESHGLENEVLGLPVEDLDEATKRAVELCETGSVKWSGS